MSDQPIIVRMPPSPTGPLHLGTARTALFNYLLAKNQGGEIVFRWEDTDQERSKSEYETEIMQGLKWLGMDFEKESKMVVRQTNSTKYHQTQTLKLWEKGLIFPCDTPPEIIDQQRQEAEKNKTNFVFWSPNRDKSKTELQALIDAGGKYVWRLKTPQDRPITFEDGVRNKVEISTNTLGDFVVARMDGSPLYALANVLDDHREGITHVIRGEDHISNTPKQILLWETLEVTPPLYAHIPLVLDTKGAKLSKRKVDPDICVLIKDFQAQGFLPEAVINGLAFLGWHPKTEEEIFSLDQLAQKFSLAGVNKAGSKYDFEKMKWFNHAWMQKIPVEDLANRFLTWLPSSQENTKDLRQVEASKLHKALSIACQKAKTFADLADEISYVLLPIRPIDPAHLVNEKMKIDQALAQKVLMEVKAMLKLIPLDQFTAETIKAKSIEKIAEMELKNGQFLSPFRSALSGRERSMGPFDMAEIMGKEESLKRIGSALC